MHSLVSHISILTNLFVAKQYDCSRLTFNSQNSIQVKQSYRSEIEIWSYFEIKSITHEGTLIARGNADDTEEL